MQVRLRFGLVARISRAMLCRDRACRGREMQLRLRYGFGTCNPLRRSCVSGARNAGEIAFWIGAPLREITTCAQVGRQSGVHFHKGFSVKPTSVPRGNE